MKTSGLSEYVRGTMLSKYNVSIDSNIELTAILDIVDDHIIKLINRSGTEKIAKMVPSVIEAVKMELLEERLNRKRKEL